MSENTVISAIQQQEWLQPIQDSGSDLVKQAFAAAGPAGQATKNALHGVFLGHPLHPAITDVPVGSWTVTAALDLLEIRGDNQYRAGADFAVLLGLLASVPAALSGITDWADTHGRPQRLGAMHGILNSAAMAAYLVSYAARRSERRGWGKFFGFIGYGLVGAGAYLGGDLTFSTRTGVNHAPEAEYDLPSEFQAACPLADLVEGKPHKVTLGRVDIMVVKTSDSIYALADQCSHLAGPLSEGKIEGDSVVCPWHNSRFCLKDGRVVDGPATQNQHSLDVKVDHGQVMLKGRASA
jgi:nitrite reductase/ring-hydroxylating ferredoxin subunit/uncharacterized membrane protein